ncbi:galactokinase [Candidatus Woesearchaeota archaeon]|nr:galactokinase [Candidatus Woesearchaeota archaeon]
MIISRTPFRIPIGGGGTDLPFYYTKKGGSLISATVDKYMYIIVQKRILYDDFFIRYKKTEMTKTLDEIQHPLVREALRLLNIKEPIEITSVADLPAGSGLGSSSSFLVGVLHALHAYKGEKVSKKTLADEATQIQMEILRTEAGLQDQYAAAFGGIMTMNINKNGKVIVSPLDIADHHLRALEKNLVFLYTGLTRSADEVLASQRKEAETDEEKINGLTQIKEIGEEIKKALEAGNLRRFGEWMNIHWQTKQKLSKKMTNSKIDEWYNIALQNGAIGGKIMGAGGGGFFMFYVDKDKEKFIQEMSKAGLIPLDFHFEFDGSTIVFNNERG